MAFGFDKLNSGKTFLQTALLNFLNFYILKLVIRPVVASYICFSWTFLDIFWFPQNRAYFDLLLLHLLLHIDIS